MTQLDPTDPRIPEHLQARMQPQPNNDGEGQYPPPVEGGGEALIAFANALNAIENIAKTQTADTGKYTYRYADLGDVLDEVKRCAQMFKLAVTQNGSVTNGLLAVSTTLIHYETGQWLTFPAMMMKLPGDAQALGSALTYLRRYSLLTIFGIAPEDDDGRAATQSERTQQATDGNRSEAERMIRNTLSNLDGETRRLLIEDFRSTFGMGLSDLPVPKHGDALTWVRTWTPPQPEPETAEGSGEDGGGGGSTAPPAVPAQTDAEAQQAVEDAEDQRQGMLDTRTAEQVADDDAERHVSG